VKPTRVCTKCGVKKELNKTNFIPRYGKEKHVAKGFRSDCRECYNKLTRGNPRYLRKALLRHAKKRALNKGLDFNLTLEDLTYPDVCPILGIKLKHGYGKGKDRENSPSIDRIDNTKGYTLDNVIIVSVLANSIKNSATPEQIIKVGEFYKNLHKERGVINETN
jgi:hypothetical protein|tara:strand:- start:991 stop:1482 length:492 start_codon:yes stop_codon:yes gene_type:complete